jgi:hypothetical protein
MYWQQMHQNQMQFQQALQYHPAPYNPGVHCTTQYLGGGATSMNCY